MFNYCFCFLLYSLVMHHLEVVLCSNLEIVPSVLLQLFLSCSSCWIQYFRTLMMDFVVHQKDWRWTHHYFHIHRIRTIQQCSLIRWGHWALWNRVYSVSRLWYPALHTWRVPNPLLPVSKLPLQIVRITRTWYKSPQTGTERSARLACTNSWPRLNKRCWTERRSTFRSC